MKILMEHYCRISIVVKVAFYFIIITEPLKQEVFGSQRAVSCKRDTS